MGWGLKLLFSSTPVWQLGAETGMQSSDLQFMRNAIRVMPLMVLPVTIHFPSVGNGFVAASKSSRLGPLNKLTRLTRGPEHLLSTHPGSVHVLAVLQCVLPVPSGLPPDSSCALSA